MFLLNDTATFTSYQPTSLHVLMHPFMFHIFVTQYHYCNTHTRLLATETLKGICVSFGIAWHILKEPELC